MTEYERIGKIKLTELAPLIETQKTHLIQIKKAYNEKEKKELMETHTSIIKSILDKLTEEYMNSIITRIVAGNHHRVIFYDYECTKNDSNNNSIEKLVTTPIYLLSINHQDLITSHGMIDTSRSIIQLIENLIPDEIRLYYGYSAANTYYQIVFRYGSMYCNDPCCFIICCHSRTCNFFFRSIGWCLWDVYEDELICPCLQV